LKLPDIKPKKAISKPQTERPDLREQILDAAESLFADRGYFGVSVREITDAASTRLAAVNYHFGTKEALFTEVIERRSAWLNEERLRRLAELDLDPDRPEASARLLIRAFYGPLLSRFESGEPGWMNYCRLISQIAGVQLWMDEIVAPLFDEISRRYVEAMISIKPKSSRDDALQAYQFILSCTLYTFADNRRIDHMSGGRLSSRNISVTLKAMEDFCVGGLLSCLRVQGIGKLDG
jgi:AcrR family transcriptional regulator|tara:strand:+ start:630 stop:1337 length:708 start_codon:yes stop_codon:yes gene_type:complete